MKPGFNLYCVLILIARVLVCNVQGINLLKNRNNINSFLSIKETFGNKEGSQPLSKEEFEFRITTLMLNGIKHEKLKKNPNDRLGPYESAFRYNKMFRCTFGKNLLFSTKVLFHAVSIKMRASKINLSKDIFKTQQIITHFTTLQKQIQDIQSVGLNILCHKEISDVEIRVDPNVENLIKTLRETRLTVLEDILEYFTTFVNYKFSQTNGAEGPLSDDFLTYVSEVNTFWNEKRQNPDILKEIQDKFEASLKKVNSHPNTPEGTKKWGVLFGELFKSYVRSKFVLQSDSPLLVVKHETVMLYDRLINTLRQLEVFFTEELGFIDENNIFRIAKHFLDAFGTGALMVAQTYYIYFQEEEYIAPPIKDQSNFNAFTSNKIFDRAAEASINYKTCSILAECEEVLKSQQRIINTLAELPFSVLLEDSANQITSIIEYQEPIRHIFNKICLTEADICLQVLLNKRGNFGTVAQIINKIEPAFFPKLVKLRKTGPITHVGISQNSEEESYYIKMGYMAPYQNKDKSLMVWICRYCGGDMAISDISFKPGTIEDYKNIVPEPTKSLTLIQIFKDVVMFLEKVIIDSPVLFPLDKRPDLGVLELQEMKLLSALLSEPVENAAIWDIFKFINTKTGFFTMYNKWNVHDFDWKESEKPLLFPERWEVENQCFCLIIRSSQKCKLDLISTFKSDITYEDSFEDYEMWTFKPKGGKSITEMVKTIKDLDCVFINYFESKPNSVFVLIDAENKRLLEEKGAQDDPKASDLRFERVPQQPLYVAYQWLYPFEESSKDKKWDELTLAFLREIMLQELNIKEKVYEEVLCDNSNANFCSFIDTGDEFKRKVVGDENSFPSDTDLNFAKVLNPKSSETPPNCAKLFNSIPQLKTASIGEYNSLASSIQAAFSALAQNDCEAAKTFTIKFTCNNKIRYLSGTALGLQEFCYEREKEATFVPPDSKFPVEREYSIAFKLTTFEKPIFARKLEDIKKNGYYIIAEWITNPVTPLAGKSRQFFLQTAVFVRLDAINANFIGIPDSYSDEECISLYGHWSRYLSLSMNKYDSDSFQYKYSHALSYSLQPQNLEKYQDKYNIAAGETAKLKTFLSTTQCSFLRLWIPIKWVGDDTNSCMQEFSVKNLKNIPNIGLKELCDGSKLPIDVVYYLEFLSYEDTSLPGYDSPSEVELEVARKHGFVPYGNRFPIEFSSEGYSTKVRVWAKPRVNSNSLRRILCDNIDDGNYDPDEGEDASIYTRIVIKSNNIYKKVCRRR